VNEARRQAYLEALGLDVWVARPAPAEASALQVGPGEHSTLLVCDSAEASALRIAGDIARAIGGQPVWAWPADRQSDGAVSLEQAVSERLFTRVIVFGPLAESCLPGRSAVLGSASVAVTCSLGELAGQGQSRRDFWKLLREDRSGSSRAGIK